VHATHDHVDLARRSIIVATAAQSRPVLSIWFLPDTETLTASIDGLQPVPVGDGGCRKHEHVG